jgi:hypothetical protein
MKELSVGEQRYKAVMAVLGDGMPGESRIGAVLRSGFWPGINLALANRSDKGPDRTGAASTNVFGTELAEEKARA